MREVDPTEQLDEEVEEILLQLADDFVESTVNAACLLAKHRKSNTVDVKDVQLHLGTIVTVYKIIENPIITIIYLLKLQYVALLVSQQD